jgi:hypothetical protein
MRDFISPAQRLSNPQRKWVRDGFKDVAVTAVLCVVFLFLLTQPN